MQQVQLPSKCNAERAEKHRKSVSSRQGRHEKSEISFLARMEQGGSLASCVVPMDAQDLCDSISATGQSIRPLVQPGMVIVNSLHQKPETSQADLT